MGVEPGIISTGGAELNGLCLRAWFWLLQQSVIARDRGSPIHFTEVGEADESRTATHTASPTELSFRTRVKLARTVISARVARRNPLRSKLASATLL
jgi:hypothetical protein